LPGTGTRGGGLTCQCKIQERHSCHEQELGEEDTPASARYRKGILARNRNSGRRTILQCKIQERHSCQEQELGEEDYPASAGYRKGTLARSKIQEMHSCQEQELGTGTDRRGITFLQDQAGEG
jgi:hypothetical protein